MTRVAPLLLLLTLWLPAGCESLERLGRAQPEPPAPADVPAGQVYIDLLAELVTADPATQRTLVESAAAVADAEPSHDHRLRHALLLSMPGHPDSDTLAAQGHFSRLLADSSELTPVQLEVTRVFMAYAQQWQKLQAGYGELSWKLSQQQAHGQQQRDRELEALRLQVERLGQELKEAEAKLEAIATIERELERSESDGE